LETIIIVLLITVLILYIGKPTHTGLISQLKEGMIMTMIEEDGNIIKSGRGTMIMENIWDGIKEKAIPTVTKDGNYDD
jgi:hypothetical protein